MCSGKHLFMAIESTIRVSDFNGNENAKKKGFPFVFHHCTFADSFYFAPLPFPQI